MRWLAIFLIAFNMFQSTAVAADIYFDNAAVGGGTGVDCAHARAYSSHVIGDDAAGNVLHVCGTGTVTTNTTALTSLAAGSSGNPITIKFETGADLKSAAFSANGAINIQHAFWTVDCGTNGIIENTLNGDVGGTCSGGTCTQQNGNSRGVNSNTSANNLIVQNCTIKGLFIKTANLNDSTLDQAQGITLAGNNSRATQNTISDGYTSIAVSTPSTSQSNVEVDHNTMSKCAHCFTLGYTGANTTGTGMKIHDNDFAGNAAMYDNTNDEYHRNAVILFADSASCTPNCRITAKLYNNYLHGSWTLTGQGTAAIFLDDTSSNTITVSIFNNIFDEAAGDGGWSNGYIVQTQNTADSGNIIVNNTWAPHLINNGTCARLDNQTNLTFENNLIQQCGYAFNSGGPTPTLTTPTIDYNTWYSTVQSWFFPPACGTGCTFTSWTGAGYDAHGQNGNNPLINANFTLQAGSSAIGKGTNLTSFASTNSIPELLTGAPQTFGAGGTCGTGCLARPSVGNWDAGAYPFTSGAQAAPGPAPTMMVLGPDFQSSKSVN